METKTIDPNLLKLLNAVEAVLKLPKERIDPDAELASFGMDSIIALEVLGYLAKKESIQISPAQMASVDSLRQLAEVLLPAPLEASSPRPVVGLAIESDVRVNPLRELIRSQYGITVQVSPDMTVDDVVELLLDHHEEKLQDFYQPESFSPLQSSQAAQPVTPFEEKAAIEQAGPYVIGIAVANMYTRENESNVEDYFDADFFGVNGSGFHTSLFETDKKLLMVIYRALEDAGVKPSALTGKNVGVFLGWEEPQMISDCSEITSNNSSAYLTLPAKICAIYDWCGPTEIHQHSDISGAIALDSARRAMLNNACDLAIVIGVDRDSQLALDAQESHPSPSIAVLVLCGVNTGVSAQVSSYGQITASVTGYCGTAITPDFIQVDAFQQVLKTCYTSISISKGGFENIAVANLGGAWKQDVERDVLVQFYRNLFDRELNRNPATIAFCPATCQGLMTIVENLCSNRSEKSADRIAVNFISGTGALCHFVMNRGEEKLPPPLNKKPHDLVFVLSSHNFESLYHQVKQCRQFISQQGSERLAELIYSLQVCREIYDHRLAIICRDAEELAAQLDRLLEQFSALIGAESEARLFVARCGMDQPWVKLVSGAMLQTELAISQQTNDWQALVRLWVLGAPVPWHQLWSSAPQLNHGLPAYQFAKNIGQTEGSSRKMSHSPGFSVPIWRRQNLASASSVQRHPAKSLLLQVGRIISQVTGFPMGKLAVDQPLEDFQVSASSLREIVKQLELHWNISLSASAVQSQRSWQVLAELVESALPKPEDLLVALQTRGERIPYFALPGAGGSVNVFNPLGKALGQFQSLWGIQSPGVSEKTHPIDRVEALAAINLAALQKVQSTGPYQLVGYSNGGVIAFEMARQLIAQGECVQRLVMIDTVSPLMRVNDVDEEMTKVCNDLLATLSDTTRIVVDTLRAIPPDSRCDYLYHLLKNEGFALPYQQFARTYQLIMTSDAACRSYQPEPIDPGIPIELFCAQEGYLNLPEDYGWRELNERGVQIFTVKANHVSIMHERPSEEIARHLLKDRVNVTEKQQRKAKRQGNARVISE